MKSWEETYPSVAMVSEASAQTLHTWRERLPAPQTDVEHTVRRRIEARYIDACREEVRARAPAVADKWNELMDKVDKLTGKKGMRL